MILDLRCRLEISRERVSFPPSSLPTAEPLYSLQMLRSVIVIHPDIHYLFDVARNHSDVEEESAVRELSIIHCSDDFVAWYRGRASLGLPCDLSESSVPLCWEHHGPNGFDHNASYPWAAETDGEALILVDVSRP
jgi:hypothetical protein